MVNTASALSNLLSWVLILLCLGISAARADIIAPSITLSSENDAIYLGDSVIIEMQTIGLIDAPDLSGLFNGADLLRETTGTRIAVIEGRVVEVKLRRMEFLPKREGAVNFGPLHGVAANGEIVSNSLVVNVAPPVDTNWQPDSDDFRVDISVWLDDAETMLMDANKEFSGVIAPFVGQHITVDITLRQRYPTAEEEVLIPAFDGFDVLSQFTEKRTIEDDANGDSWRSIAWRYHLFAQRSGPLTIDGVRWSGTAIRSRTQRSPFQRETRPFTLNIQPALGNSWWLPATRLSLTDDWSKDPRELSAGDEITRTITLTAANVLSNHLPDVVPLESRALKSTLIRHSRQQKLLEDTITATAEFEYRMVAQSPIPVFLDTVRVPWFNTLSNSSQEAIIPARRINVGLPDRADLLADIALNDSWWDKLILTLRGSVKTPALAHISLTLMGLGAAFLWLNEWWQRRRLLRSWSSDSSQGCLPEL